MDRFQLGQPPPTPPQPGMAPPMPPTPMPPPASAPMPSGPHMMPNGQMMGGAPPPPQQPRSPQPASRFAPTSPAQGPDQAARAAYLDARANGHPRAEEAARDAWRGGLAELADRLEDKNQPPQNPGEANLQMIYDHLRQRGTDPFVAAATAHKFVSQLAQQAGQQGQQGAKQGQRRTYQPPMAGGR